MKVIPVQSQPWTLGITVELQGSWSVKSESSETGCGQRVGETGTTQSSEKPNDDPKSLWKYPVTFHFRENNLRPRGDETICQQRPQL